MKKIIIIDDDTAIQDALTAMLQLDGYVADTHSDAGFIFEHQYILPVLFLIDRQLTGIDGLDVCRFLKLNAATSQIPVVIFSASPAAEKMAMRAGADAFIEKPFNLATLRHILEKYTAAA